MKNLTKSLIAASMLLAGSAIAADGPAVGDSGSTIVKGHVTEVCELDGIPMMISLGDDPENGAYVHTDEGMTVQCNNPHGATFTLSRTNGKLVNAWDDTLGLNYKAELDVAIQNFPKVVLKDGALSDSQDVDRDNMLAMGAIAGIHITLMEQPKFSGWYYDEVTVAIAGR